jgi:hypothetical protein
MRWFVDAWNPAYGSSFDQDDSPGEGRSEADLGVELEPSAWAPRRVPAEIRAPDRVYLVDGVRRDDATLWTAEEDGASLPGLAASFAAGVVRCDLRRGGAEVVNARVDRALFTASPNAPELRAGQVWYRLQRVDITDPARLSKAVQGPLTKLEIDVSEAVREPGDDDLLIVDGRLRGREHLPRAIGYVKKQRGRYLPADLSTVVTSLTPGERSPVFRITDWGGSYSWYLRLPGPAGAPWSGIVRLESSPELTPTEAIALADVSAATLPRFASASYKDPRAPQNLVPIGGLERRLRAMLGDPRLLHRGLVAAAAATARRPGTPPATARPTNASPAARVADGAGAAARVAAPEPAGGRR